MRAAAALALAGGLLAATPAAPAAARELWSRGDFSLDFTGSLREIASWTRGTDSGDFLAAAAGDLSCVSAASFPDCLAFALTDEREVGQSLTRLRTEFALHMPAGLSAHLSYDHELLAGVLDTLESGLSSGFGSDTFLGAEGSILEGEHAEWRHRLYRGTLEFTSEHAELVAGRQRVAWGVGRLWNPIDRFNPIPPLAIEGDQSPGVDALLLRWVIDGFDNLEAVYAPGTSREEARAALRFHGVLLDADFSLVGGVFEQAPTAGFDVERHVGEAAVHFEVVWTDPQRSIWPVGAPRPLELPDYWQVVGSVDWNLDWGNGVYLVLEHFYNGNALGLGRGRAGVLLPFFEATSQPPTPEAALLPGPYVTGASRDVFGSSPLVSLAKHQTGIQASTEFTPGIRGSLLTIYDWNGRSVVFFPSLTYSPLGSLELTLGAQVGVGPRLSQFGSAPPLVYLLAEWFF